MARVFRLIATNKEHPHFESDTANDDFHVAIFFAGYSTACGVQLDGDDGVSMVLFKRAMLLAQFARELYPKFKRYVIGDRSDG